MVIYMIFLRSYKTIKNRADPLKFPGTFIEIETVKILVYFFLLWKRLQLSLVLIIIRILKKTCLLLHKLNMNISYILKRYKILMFQRVNYYNSASIIVFVEYDSVEAARSD